MSVYDDMRASLVSAIWSRLQAQKLGVSVADAHHAVDQALATSGYADLIAGLTAADAAVTALQGNQAAGAPPAPVTAALAAWTPARLAVHDHPVNGQALP